MKRRDCLRLAAVAAGGAAVATVWPLRSWVHRLVAPALPETPPGPLGQRSLASLVAAAEAFIGYPLKVAHYADFFRWRAEHLPGHRALYDRFAAVVDDSAKRLNGCTFVECPEGTRRRILAAGFAVDHTRGRLNRLRVEILDRDGLLFDEYIIRPTVSLFARTDAWLLVGYPAWPGTPRGFESRRKAALRGAQAR